MRGGGGGRGGIKYRKTAPPQFLVVRYGDRDTDGQTDRVTDTDRQTDGKGGGGGYRFTVKLVSNESKSVVPSRNNFPCSTPQHLRPPPSPPTPPPHPPSPQWSPSHCGVGAMRKRTWLCKVGATLEQSARPKSYSQANVILRNSSRTEWRQSLNMKKKRPSSTSWTEQPKSQSLD